MDTTHFVGRERALQKLNDLSTSGRPCLVVIKGRRRIGKSRLALEFAKGKRLLSFVGLAPKDDQNAITAEEQRDAFARQYALQFHLPPLQFADWSDAFTHLTKQLTQEPTVILLDEISWMGSKDPTFIPKLKNWWDLEVQKFPSLTVIFCGSVSTWIEKNILNSTAFFGRITLTLTLRELTLTESIELLYAKGIQCSSYDLFKILAVTGGVPWYLEQMLPHLTIDENLKRLCFEPDGLFTLEFDKIFHDLFQTRSHVYKAIIRLLADGMRSLEEIREALRYAKSGTLGKRLEALIISGFVAEHASTDFKSGKEKRQKLYRLSDNYLRFFLKYIEPNLSKVNKGGFEHFSLSQLPGFEAMLGFQIETLLLNNRPLLLSAIGINPLDVVSDSPYRQIATGSHTGCQIDYLIQTEVHNLYLCEFKFKKREIDTSILEEMERKKKSLIAPKGFSKIAVLFHLGGVSEAVQEKGYFYRLIDINDFVPASVEAPTPKRSAASASAPPT